MKIKIKDLEFVFKKIFFSESYLLKRRLKRAINKNYEKELSKINVKNKQLQEINVRIDSIKKKLSDLQNERQQVVSDIEQSNKEIKSLKKLYERAEVDLRNILKSD